jgi:hypothetical protein
VDLIGLYDEVLAMTADVKAVQFVRQRGVEMPGALGVVFPLSVTTQCPQSLGSAVSRYPVHGPD